VTFRARGHLLGGAFRDDFPALIARIRPQINNPIRRFYHVEIMLNDDDRMARIHEPLKNLQQDANILEMKPCGWLIKEE
jgi:hypothetical protein